MFGHYARLGLSVKMKNLKLPILALAVLSLATIRGRSDEKRVIASPAGPSDLPLRVPTPTRSIAVTNYTGLEKKPVTLEPGTKIYKKRLMKNVNKSTLLIILRNSSGHLSDESTQFWITSEKFNRGLYAGLGPLFPGEVRIIKVHKITPAKVMLLWYRYVPEKPTPDYRQFVWRSENPVQGGQPLVLTILPNDTIGVRRKLN